MEIIKVENVGLKLRMHARHKKSIKSVVGDIVKRRQKKDNSFWALRNINFTVNKGQVVGIIGKNGSGKSTLLRVIAGIFAADEGTIKINGSVSTILSITTGFQQELSGLENIYLSGILMGFREDEIQKAIDEIVEFSELGSFIYSPVKVYSSGMGARLGFSIAMTLKRDIMLIDEILSVGDFKFREKCEKKTKELMSENRTIVLVSHNMETIKKFSNQVLWIDKGELKSYGNSEKVINDYLGRN